MTLRNTRITEIEENLRVVHAQSVREIKIIQEECPHEKIIAGGERRICAVCGYEECYRYSWGASTTTDGGFYEFIAPPNVKSKLYSCEFVKQDDVTKYRIKL